MTIRCATLTPPRRLIPTDRGSVAFQRVVARQPIDSFEGPVVVRSAQTGVVQQAAQQGGGFFSRLLGGLKGWASGLLQRAQGLVAPLLGQAQTWLSGMLGGFFSKAGSWLTGLLDSWRTKLGS